MDAGHEQGDEQLPLAEHVALALRGLRRREGLSQRGLAQSLGWTQSRVSRLETRAGDMPLDTVQEAVEAAGLELVLMVAGRPVGRSDWEQTDLIARDRRGRRFPAQRPVYPCAEGPYWWWEQEFLRLSRRLGPQPHWTTVARDMWADRRGDV